MGFLMHYFYLPVYHELKLISTYQVSNSFKGSTAKHSIDAVAAHSDLCASFGLQSGDWRPTYTLLHTMVCLVCIFYTCVLAKRNDQLLPLLVMETLGGLPGLPGLLWLVYLVLLYRLSPLA
ncbi:hypothetical protein EVAR_101376_1 [Eumeta japonica]|uniref:Uncharacterized protein n=1 Tax=Eumeta variegata TaxID=151549 RepID=A0A4C1T6E2_EUMVA|nr:hypothetical protein EVAR_101376_1 [Eumeta japonica]